jgi:uncharacterized protein YwgA
VLDNIKDFITEMSEVDKIVLITIANSGKIKSTRLQKLTLIIKAVYDGKIDLHKPYLFGGFSDEVDESVNSLRSEGFLIYENGFRINEDGEKLYKALLSEEHELDQIAKYVIKMMEGLSDKQVTAITYKLFPALTKNSIIKDEMEMVGKDIIVQSFDINEIRMRKKDGTDKKD